MALDLVTLQQSLPEAEAVTLGDSRALSDRLVAFMRSGGMHAFSDAARKYGPGLRVPPKRGRRDIVVNWDGVPEFVIEYTEVTYRRFSEVNAQFAKAEGEPLATWQDSHRALLERTGGFDEQEQMMCARFKLVRDLAP